MYGSIFNLKPKKGKKEELINHLKINEEKPDEIFYYCGEPRQRDEHVEAIMALFDGMQSEIEIQVLDKDVIA